MQIWIAARVLIPTFSSSCCHWVQRKLYNYWVQSNNWRAFNSNKQATALAPNKSPTVANLYQALYLSSPSPGRQPVLSQENTQRRVQQMINTIDRDAQQFGGKETIYFVLVCFGQVFTTSVGYTASRVELISSYLSLRDVLWLLPTGIHQIGVSNSFLFERFWDLPLLSIVVWANILLSHWAFPVLHGLRHSNKRDNSSIFSWYHTDIMYIVDIPTGSQWLEPIPAWDCFEVISGHPSRWTSLEQTIFITRGRNTLLNKNREFCGATWFKSMRFLQIWKFDLTQHSFSCEAEKNAAERNKQFQFQYVPISYQ